MEISYWEKCATRARIPSLPSGGRSDKAIIFPKWKLEVLARGLATCLEKRGEASQILGKLSVLVSKAMLQ